MARPREFDEEQALDRAMEVFWRKGYRNTSLDELLDAMGIQRGSFYNTFGSKRKTYLRALNRYADFMTEGGPYSELAQQKPGMPALFGLLKQYLASVTGDSLVKGCFFTHASKEHRGDDPEVKQAVLNGIARMKELIRESTEAAQREGQLPPDIDPDSTALLFMSVAWGLHVMAEAGVPLEDLMAAGSQLFGMSPSAP
ncbi:MAG: TetR/AcrR family transcriptional regulator [Gemmatimonadota bacterium]|nr:MAG: TetR/AcrR family transcriptional regulator [Gemmatimonadota bacterium]